MVMIIHQNVNRVNYYFSKIKKRGSPRILAARYGKTDRYGLLRPVCFFSCLHASRRSTAASRYFLSYRSFQISLLYSAIVLSEEKKPAFAMLTSIIFLHFF